MRDYIHYGKRILINGDGYIVMSYLDDNGYFLLESEDLVAFIPLHISETHLNGFAFDGTPYVEIKRMDYDLGI
jgi:hypothetical protein